MARVARWLLDHWNRCVRALRNSTDNPAGEPPTFQNCWSWALKRWLIHGGHLVVMRSPRAPIVRACWAPRGDRGPLWHFEPLHPKTGLAAIWHAYLHRGKPVDLRNRKRGNRRTDRTDG